MAADLCSRGIYGCKHDENHIPTRETVLQYFADNDGYVLSRDLWSRFGYCTEERAKAFSEVISDLQYRTKEIAPVSPSAWGLVGHDNPKIHKQTSFIFQELPPGKTHFMQDGVMIHDRDGALLYEYVSTEDVNLVTCGVCLNILKARAKKTN
ncbi:MAG TPA: hypothetical protein VN843_23335 [Anaerolineales bacterium]|nr:hypothetical protein [Anaerolineales bacterium]